MLPSLNIIDVLRPLAGNYEELVALLVQRPQVDTHTAAAMLTSIEAKIRERLDEVQQLQRDNRANWGTIPL